jgi:hypothetical protein
MEAKLVANGYRFDSLIEAIVTSPQFRNKRTSEVTAKTPVPSKASLTTPGSAKMAEEKKRM